MDRADERALSTRLARPSGLGLVLTVFAVLATGCGPNSSDDGSTPSGCDPACRQGYTCQNGQCIENSGCQPPCRVGFVCDGGQCVPEQDQTDDNDDNDDNGNGIGHACKNDSECASSTCLSGQGIPDGYCSKACGARVQNDGSDCPSGSVCLPVNNSASYCLDGCQSDADCRTGYACVQSQGTSVCLPKCQSNADCGSGQYCDTSDGRCKERDNQSNDGQLGSACSADDKCSGSACLTEQDTNGSFPSGYCATGCQAGQEGSTCKNDEGLCVGLPADGGTTYACLQNCTTGNECRDGYICTADVGGTNDQGLGFCWPHCRNFACSDGQSCNSATGICEEDDGGGGGANQELIHRNVWNGQLGRQQIRQVTVDIPKNTYSFSIISKPRNASGISPILVRLDGPGGRTLFDANSPFNSKIDLFPHKNSSGGTHAFLVPNSPDYNVRSGTYTMHLAATQTAEVRTDLLAKTGSVRDQDNVLPLTFWVLPQSHLSAADAKNHRKFQQALSTLKSIYKRMGIQVGKVRYHEVTGQKARDLAVVDDGQFPELFSLIDPDRAEGLNFVVVDHFAGRGGGGQTLGRSGGIPGPPAHPKVPTGGVAVAAATLPHKDGDFFGAVMAHEGGHYMGLRHTTEQPGTVFDPLDDTPQCSAQNDANGNGVVEPDECVGNGTSNLMFWAANDRFPKQVTDAQSFVLQHNPSLE